MTQRRKESAHSYANSNLPMFVLQLRMLIAYRTGRMSSYHLEIWKMRDCSSWHFHSKWLLKGNYTQKCFPLKTMQVINWFLNTACLTLGIQKSDSRVVVVAFLEWPKSSSFILHTPIAYGHLVNTLLKARIKSGAVWLRYLAMTLHQLFQLAEIILAVKRAHPHSSPYLKRPNPQKFGKRKSLASLCNNIIGWEVIPPSLPQSNFCKRNPHTSVATSLSFSFSSPTPLFFPPITLHSNM